MALSKLEIASSYCFLSARLIPLFKRSAARVFERYLLKAKKPIKLPIASRQSTVPPKRIHNDLAFFFVPIKVSSDLSSWVEDTWGTVRESWFINSVDSADCL